MADIDFLRTREYKDLSLTFGKNPVTNDVISITGEDAIKRAIKNLLLMSLGEVPFFPNLGSNVRGLLFEPADPITMSSLDDSIRTCLSAFEPRIRIVSLDIVPDKDGLTYTVNIVFRLVNLRDPITLSISLKRLR